DALDRGRLWSRRRAGELHLSGRHRDPDALPLGGVLRRARGGDARTPGWTRAVAADGAPGGNREPGVLSGFGRVVLHDRDGDPSGRWNERGVMGNLRLAAWDRGRHGNAKNTARGYEPPVLIHSSGMGSLSQPQNRSPSTTKNGDRKCRADRHLA